MEEKILFQYLYTQIMSTAPRESSQLLENLKTSSDSTNLLQLSRSPQIFHRKHFRKMSLVISIISRPTKRNGHGFLPFTSVRGITVIVIKPVWKAQAGVRRFLSSPAIPRSAFLICATQSFLRTPPSRRERRRPSRSDRSQLVASRLR